MLPEIGLLYDIVGAILVTRAVAFTADKILAAQAGTYWDGNIALFAALEEQRHDGRFGLVFLLSGFILQFLGALGINSPVWIEYAIAGGIPVGLVAYALLRGRLQATRKERFRKIVIDRIVPNDSQVKP